MYIHNSAGKGQRSTSAAHIRGAIECLNVAIKRAGGIVPFTQEMGVSHQVVYQWRKRGYVPAERALIIAKKYGLPFRKMLRFEVVELLSQASKRRAI
jgi:hypothetical protein